jgi:hypothetical protein
MKPSPWLIGLAATVAISGCAGASSDRTEATTTSIPAEISTTTSTIPPTYSPETVLAALPTLDDLPAGWTERSMPEVRTLEPKEGPFFGLCGGRNSDALGQDAGVPYVVESGSFSSGDGIELARFSVAVFPDSTAADAYLASLPGPCPISVNAVAESDVSGSAQAGGEEETFSWEYSESVDRFKPQENGVGQRQGRIQKEFFLAAGECEGQDCSYAVTKVYLVERAGNIVFTTLVGSRTDRQGFVNSDQFTSRAPTIADAESVAETLVPITLQRLQNA